MPPCFVVESPAALQANDTITRSSASSRASGAFPVWSSFHTALPPKMSPAPGRVHDRDALQAVHMAACAAVLEPAAVRAARHKHELHRIVVKNILCAVLHAEAEQELDLLIADLHHIGLPEAPEHLLLCLVEAAPERLAQVRIVGDELPMCLCILHGTVCRCPGRLVCE